ncbi:hypothetical protein [Erythrobacter sp. QSSC1-22B]|uniref:hypothetical protein n=1 Tax=Erythrobacter sp. QSSC1-22B TaxID=1860125 RepID=UPI00143B7635|nr:hypothetical protein [Erythrobacter sp. QSSC1-22B]
MGSDQPTKQRERQRCSTNFIRAGIRETADMSLIGEPFVSVEQVGGPKGFYIST